MYEVSLEELIGVGKVPQKFEVLRRNILMINWCCLCSSKVSLSCLTPLFNGRRDMVVVFSPMLLILYRCTISRFYIYKKLTFLWKKKFN